RLSKKRSSRVPPVIRRTDLFFAATLAKRALGESHSPSTRTDSSDSVSKDMPDFIERFGEAVGIFATCLRHVLFSPASALNQGSDLFDQPLRVDISLHQIGTDRNEELASLADVNAKRDNARFHL